jgi:hypothetical protein
MIAASLMSYGAQAVFFLIATVLFLAAGAVAYVAKAFWGHFAGGLALWMFWTL